MSGGNTPASTRDRRKDWDAVGMRGRRRRVAAVVPALAAVRRGVRRPVAAGYPGQVAGEPVEQVVVVEEPERRARRFEQVHRDDQLRPAARRRQQPGHLDRDHTAHGPAAEQQGPVRLDREDLLDVVGGQIGQGRRGQVVGGLQRENGRSPPIRAASSA